MFPFGLLSDRQVLRRLRSESDAHGRRLDQLPPQTSELLAVRLTSGPSSASDPPAMQSATITASGNQLTLTFSQPVTGTAGFVIFPSGGASTLTYVSGSGTGTYVFSLSRPIGPTETALMSYVVPPGNLTNAGSTALAAFSGVGVTNNGSAAPSPVSTLGRYAWTERAWEADGPRYDRPGGMFGTMTFNPAYAPNGETITTPCDCFLRWATETASAGGRWEIIANGVGGAAAPVVLRVASNYPTGATTPTNPTQGYVQAWADTPGSPVGRATDTGGPVLIYDTRGAAFRLKPNDYVLGLKMGRSVLAGMDVYFADAYEPPDPLSPGFAGPVPPGFTSNQIPFNQPGVYLLTVTGQLSGTKVSNYNQFPDLTVTANLVGVGGIIGLANPGVSFTHSFGVLAGGQLPDGTSGVAIRSSIPFFYTTIIGVTDAGAAAGGGYVNFTWTATGFSPIRGESGSAALANVNVFKIHHRYPGF